MLEESDREKLRDEDALRCDSFEIECVVGRRREATEDQAVRGGTVSCMVWPYKSL